MKEQQMIQQSNFFFSPHKNKKKKKLALAFDSSFFKSQYEFTFPEKAIEVALQRPEDRSESDIRFIRSMMMGILSFRRYSTQMQLMLARVVYYRRLEVALLKGLRRNATVVCMEDTEFLVVDRKEFFENKMDQELQKELQYRFQFFRSLDLFSTWSDQCLETLADHCKTEECHHSQVVIGDTHETKNIIFVTKGRCEVLRLVDLSRCPPFHKWIKQHEALLGRNALLCHSAKAETNSRFNERISSTIKEATDARPGSGVYSVEDLARRYSLLMSYSEDHGNLDLPKELMAAVYLRIESLQPGQYFRGVDVDYIESCFEKEGHFALDQNLCFLPTSEERDPRSMVVVSQGSEVIRIKLDKFSELADCSTLKKLKESIVPYPSDNDLCRIFLEQNRWKVFKSDLVNQLSTSSRPHHKHYMHQEKGRGGHKGQSVDKRGILQLGTNKAKEEKNEVSECSKDKEKPQHSSAEPPPIRLIHAIDIPKLCGKRIMW
uniref:Cyclic nucleotide-binding domain-containing protein n=1 Tax=Pyxicephalus adspersus TaxID=30357 RepID=A0AAV3ARP3_PYXAD|nr:TPA: hypothetical protein GDO54_012881 [Pyxicephalus adspersus]